MNKRVALHGIGYVCAGFILSVPIWNGLVMGSGAALGFGLPIFGIPAALVWSIFYLVADARTPNAPSFSKRQQIAMAVSFLVGAAIGVAFILHFT